MTADIHDADRQPFAFELLYHPVARSLSFVTATVLTLVVIAFPRAIATSITDVNHGVLAVLMWGIAGGFVHGVGYIPVHRTWRVLLGPIVGWFIMFAGLFRLVTGA
jgi:cyd operon protein YbgE